MTQRIGILPLAIVLLSACGARTGLNAPDVTEVGRDARVLRDVPRLRDRQDVADACAEVADNCGMAEICSNGIDDNCDGRVDDNCPCMPGAVQPCFGGPPGRRNVGICRDGLQVCRMSGTWGGCTGDTRPGGDVCNATDNLCTGCSRQADCPITCPSPGDPRVPDGAPFRDYPLRSADFFMGPTRSVLWVVTGGPCDEISRRPSFAVQGATSPNAVFRPTLSGDYQVKLTVITPSGTELICIWTVHVAGPGLRVEMCYPENELIDLDLHLHRPNSTSRWYNTGDVHEPGPDVCNWNNCEAHLRGGTRANWGYANSPLAECENGPLGAEWRSLGFCANPRLDIDNNLVEAIGVPENANVDVPREGERFRIMVQNFTGDRARPLVNIYCSGRRVATYGAGADIVPDFRGPPAPSLGAMWRVADVVTHVSPTRVTTCDAIQVHPPGMSTGYDVTVNEGRF